MARKLGVSLSREPIRRFVMNAVNRMRDALIKDLKGKLVYIKMDGATRQSRSFLGINVQYYNETRKKQLLKHWLVQIQKESIQASKCVTCSI